MALVSIIMGIYNCADTLQYAIDSILNQTFTDWELIMCDDASVDQTYEIANQYYQDNPEKIVLLRNKKNMKLAATLNKCLQNASGKYIARMDADDISENRRLEKQVSFLENNPDYDLVGTLMQSFDEKGLKHVVRIKEIPQKEDLPVFNPFHHATIMMKKSIYYALEGYKVSVRTSRMEDVDLWFRFFAAGYKGYNLQEVLYYVREDEQAFKRRKLRYYIHASMIVKDGIKMLKLPKRNYIYCIKPLAAWIVPRKMKILWRKNKFT